ncbi:hypothetical protein [Streptomyces sp. NPDC007346]|uniref:hypothetical protein n=1 Tax=Streptomyces sp. NPDC007346 TaxID=3154682 RepID=UPI0034573885
MTRKDITAAATRYATSTTKKPGSAAQSGTQGDQARAWSFYRTPEVRSFANWIGNAMSGALLHAGHTTSGTDIERVPDDHPAARIVAEIAGGPQGQAQLLREYGRHLAVAGEAWTVIRPLREQRTEWHVVSVLEMSRKGTNLEATIGGEPVPIPATDPDKGVPDTAPIAIRVWDPSPERHVLADSPVLGSLNELEELRLLSAAVRAVTLSRLTGRGVLVVPKGARFPTTGTKGEEEDDLIDVFLQVAETAIREPDSAAATVPIILEVPAEMVGSIQRLTFESNFDELAIQLRAENIRRFATAADIPAEFLLGLGDVNHWGQWGLTQEAVRLGIVPRLDIVTQAYTRFWLHPLLESEGIADASEYVVAADSSPLRVRTNRSQTAVQVFELGGISAQALRRETGFDESDAPTPDEIAARRHRQSPGGGTELPVDETNSDPDTLPASAAPTLNEGLVAAADGLIWAALSAAGEKLRRTPACPRSRRAQAREVQSAELHTLLRVEAVQVEQWRLLDGAWTRTPEVASRYGMDPECLADSLDTYCRELIAAGIPHSYTVVPAAISSCTEAAA